MASEIEKLKKIGQNIKKARKLKNMSQNELAELIDISREHLAKIETAKRGFSLNLLFKLSEVLEKDEKDFFEY